LSNNNHDSNINNVKPFNGLKQAFLIAGGGTGGHIFPAIAIANALKKQHPNCEILFVGANGKMEMEKVPQAGYNIKGLDIAGFNRTSLLKNIGLPFKLIKSFFQVKNIVNEFKPTAAIGVGGYSSFPVLRYCQFKNIPTFIHESNSFAGKSNIQLGKKATQIFVASDGMEKFFPAQKIKITGNPIRASIAQSIITKEEALAFFELVPSKKTLLIIGGSLGAKSINEAIANDIDKFSQNNVQVIWQTGKTNAPSYAKHSRDGIWINIFIEKMEMAYAAADVVISRAGAMSVSEICVAKKPTVFVPYPFAAEDHQTVNAQHLVQKNAALLVKDSEANAQLVTTALQLLSNPTLQKNMQLQMEKLAIANADETIATSILNYLNGK